MPNSNPGRFIAFVRSRERDLTLLGLVGISLATAIDIWIDIGDGLPASHLIHELAILSFCCVLVALQTRVILRQKRQLFDHAGAMANAAAEKEKFRRRSLRFSEGFSAAVEEQFTEWNLSQGEREIAILLIKGLSMKEIAEDRQSKESTVRQQAASVYRKARLEGRRHLTSYFLEDLFSPLPQASKSL